MSLILILLAVSIVVNLILWKDFKKTQDELLNRLMARDFGEYKIYQQSTTAKPKRSSMNDEIEAEIERARKETNGSIRA